MNKFRFAFVSRHTPTAEQMSLAEKAGIDLIPIGDMDAFSVTPEDIETHGDFAGVVVVHPAAALRLAPNFVIGVFENATRPVAGGKPTFYAKSLQVYDLSNR